MDKSVISRAVTVAGGRFAPGHLGEQTQQVPFEMVDAAVEETRRLQRRVRDLPSRVVVYLLLAAARVRAGSLEGPARGRRGRHRHHRLGQRGEPGRLLQAARRLTGGGSYPALRLLALVSCGTRNVIDAVFGPTSAGELAYAPPLLRGLRAGMILLADRNFVAGYLAAQIAAAGADFLVRVRTGRNCPKFPVLRRCGDGSWLSSFGGVPVRVIDAQVTVTTAAGSTASHAADLAGNIGRIVLASLMPARRLRTGPRVVKRAISKYNARGTIDRATYTATIHTTIITAP